MTRIIAGAAGSLALTTPGAGTRPTSDRVREAIFSALEARDEIADAAVLDLYAGSGALGLEAASRGAARVVLVESSSAAARTCTANAARVGAVVPRAELRVAAQGVRAFLGGATGGWDLVFLDPPYELADGELAADLALLAPLLAVGATVLVERSSRSPEPDWGAGIRLDRRKVYGDTTLWWATAGG